VCNYIQMLKWSQDDLARFWTEAAIELARDAVWAYADHAHHAASVAMGGTMGKEQVVHAMGATAGAMNSAWSKSGGEQLAAIRLDQVNMQAGALGVRVNLRSFVKQISCVGELRQEAGQHFFADGIAAGADAGANGGGQVFRLRAKLALHAANAGLDNSVYCATPTGMKRSNDAALAICDEDRNAVGSLYAEQQAGFCGDEAVAFARGLLAGVRGIGENDHGGMNLAQGDEGWVSVACDCFHQQASIVGDCFPIIRGCKSEVQFAGGAISGIGTAETADTGAEAVPKPGCVWGL